MGKVPVVLRKNIATNILRCREERWPGEAGGKRCAREFGVPFNRWSEWERGVHMPNEFRMRELASFFGVTTEFLRRDNSVPDAADQVCLVEAQILRFPERKCIFFPKGKHDLIQGLYRVLVTAERIQVERLQ